MAILPRLAIEVLDADPAQGPEPQPERDDGKRHGEDVEQAFRVEPGHLDMRGGGVHGAVTVAATGLESGDSQLGIART